MFGETVKHLFTPNEVPNGCSNSDEEEEETDEELQELYDDPDYLEFLASGETHGKCKDMDLEGFV